MATIRTSVEGARGCGYRKGGGLYLVSGRLSEPCPLLPIPLDVCPTCHAGIKPTRSWTWIDGQAIAVRDHPTYDEHAKRCPLDTRQVRVDEEHFGHHPLARAGLIWIGERFYKTAGAFADEAERMGVSRRIPAVPRDFELGKTWVLLAHRKVVPGALFDHEYVGEVNGEPTADGTCAHIAAGASDTCDLPEGNAAHVRLTAGIFTTFLPERVEYIVKGDETPEELDALEKRGLSLVKVVRAEEAEGLPLTMPDDTDDELQEVAP